MVSIRGTTITVTKGDTLEAIVELFLEDGSHYQPQEGDEIRFALKQHYEDRVPLLLKPIPNDTLRLRLEAEDTKRLRAGWVPYADGIPRLEEGVFDSWTRTQRETFLDFSTGFR